MRPIKPLAALAAFSLAAAPAAAQPRRAPEPAPEQVQGSELRGGGSAYVVLPILVVIALLIALLSGEDEGPESP